MAESIYVVATIKIKLDCIETARPEVLKLIEHTRQEKGNLRYDYFQDVKEPGTFVILEQFADQAAFQEHINSEHYKAVTSQLAQWVSAPTDVRILKAENIGQK